jgi:molybdopterin converting factor small subunit
MKITVKLFAGLRAERFDEKGFDIDGVHDIDHLLKMIDLKREDVTIIFINGRHAGYDTVISDGDIVALFPPIGGG